MTSLDPSPGYRRAALTLHALSAADRTWLLAQLPEAHRVALQSLLEELQSLQIPADETVIRTALEAAASSASDGRALAAVLEGEPSSMRAQLLALLAPADVQAVQQAWASALESYPMPSDGSAWTPRLKNALQSGWRELAAQEAAT